MLSTRISWRTCLRIFKTSCNFLQTIFGLRNIIICIRFRPHTKASVSTTTRGAGRLLSQYLLKWQLRINHHAHNALSILFQQRRYFIHRCSRVWSVSYSQSTCFFIWNDWITWIPYNGYGLVSRIVLVLRVNSFFLSAIFIVSALNAHVYVPAPYVFVWSGCHNTVIFPFESQ